jgi:hypothetical protein
MSARQSKRREVVTEVQSAVLLFHHVVGLLAKKAYDPRRGTTSAWLSSDRSHRRRSNELQSPRVPAATRLGTAGRCGQQARNLVLVERPAIKGRPSSALESSHRPIAL